ncbi:hypothetical protein YC2023_055395 [Brassica napus]
MVLWVNHALIGKRKPDERDTKELDGMGYFELSVFSFEITRGLLKAGDMKKIKRARPVNKTLDYKGDAKSLTTRK